MDAGDGGSNGGNGKDSPYYKGGEGSGVDVTKIPLQHVVLR